MPEIGVRLAATEQKNPRQPQALVHTVARQVPRIPVNPDTAVTSPHPNSAKVTTLPRPAHRANVSASGSSPSPHVASRTAVTA